MDLERVTKLRRLILVALFSDDMLMQHLVFKGGNAINLVHGLSQRSSIDLDLSTETDFASLLPEDPVALFDRLLNETLGPQGFIAFDVRFTRRPSAISKELEGFWGGYRIEFKIAARASFEAYRNDDRKRRTMAESIDYSHRKTFVVDISCHEYCEAKERCELDGYTVYVYSPFMIVCEKLRAICQQMPEYRAIVRSHPGSPRARDFFDINVL